MRLAAIGLAASLAGCVMAGNVMETATGDYIVTARAAPLAGGTVGANDAAWKVAQAHCAGLSKRAVVVEATERDVYQGMASAGWGNKGGGAGSANAAVGNANLTFRCIQ